MLEQSIIEKVNQWINSSFVEDASKHEIQDLLQKENNQELTERFYKNLEFGTGGMRGIIGAGHNRINIYTVRRAALALSKALKKNDAVAISYDSRRFSKIFAEEVAQVLAAQQIKSHLFSQLTPVPLLSYAIRQLKAQAGVMITASHNPINYNGIKIYWDDGAQVTPPHDKIITDFYESIDASSDIKRISLKEGMETKLIDYIPTSLIDAYDEMVMGQLPQTKKFYETQFPEEKKLKAVYTPLHGTGRLFARDLMKKCHYQMSLVSSQEMPDENFSTVKTPNPEDPSALELAVTEMIQTKSHVCYGTDPDADRLGVVLNNNGHPYYLTGNQIALLMLHYLFTHKEKPANKNLVVLKSIVTSYMQDKLCAHFGARCINTLTGFKWMCGELKKLEEKKENFEFLFASEESFGQLIHPHSRDKDAISSMALFSEIVQDCLIQGKSVLSYLSEIYREFGYYTEDLLSVNYEGQQGQEKIKRIMDFFRNNYQKLDFLKVESLEDYLDDGHGMPKSNVLGLILEGNNRLYLRPSGTEPKIKFYLMNVYSDFSSLEESEGKAKKDFESTKQRIQSLIKDI